MSDTRYWDLKTPELDLAAVARTAIGNRHERRVRAARGRRNRNNRAARAHNKA